MINSYHFLFLTELKKDHDFTVVKKCLTINVNAIYLTDGYVSHSRIQEFLEM